MNRKGFVFIETIVVISILTISLMSLYSNYAKIMTNTKELNTFDTTEYNYKTYFIKKMYNDNHLDSISDNSCSSFDLTFSDTDTKVCVIKTDVSNLNGFDAYIIDYLNTKEFGSKTDKIILVEYKKKDINNSGEYLTYISSLTL